MGTDTKAYYPNTTKPQIIDFIKKFSTRIEKELLFKDMEGYSRLGFAYRGEDRDLNLHNLDIDTERDDEDSDSWVYAKENKLPDKTKGVLTSFGWWGRSVEIVTLMAYYFGGYVNEKDTSDPKFRRVKKDHRALIRYLFNSEPIK